MSKNTINETLENLGVETVILAGKTKDGNLVSGVKGSANHVAAHLCMAMHVNPELAEIVSIANECYLHGPQPSPNVLEDFKPIS